jgi:hypothetical protein
VISGLRFDGKCIKPGTRFVVSGSGFGSKGKMLLAISYRGRALGPVKAGKWSDGRILAVVPVNRRMRADGRTPYNVALTDRRYKVLAQSKTTFTLCK